MTLTSEPILIAVLGVTGAGKTTFINKATGAGLRVGHSIISCTQEIAYASTIIDGKKVTLIDTPGFDDTERTDADILTLIAQWLTSTYQHGQLLTGIILLQSINANRAFGSEARRTRLFRQICGPDAFGNVVIASTMWSELRNKDEGISRVEERMESEDFWSQMVKQGARVVNHDNTPQSTHEVIRILLHKPKVPLKMQIELNENDGWLRKTSAAQQLYSDLGTMSAKDQQTLNELHHELRESRADRTQLMKEIQDLQQNVRQLEQQKHILQNEKCWYHQLDVSRSGSGLPLNPILRSRSLAQGYIHRNVIYQTLACSDRRIYPDKKVSSDRGAPVPEWIIALSAAGTALAVVVPVFCAMV